VVAPDAAGAVIGLVEGGAQVDNSTGEITLPIRGEGPQLLAEAVRRLDAAGIRLADIALRRPTLDEVFLQLTGRETEPEPEPTTRRGRRRRSREEGA
jgi:ABC-2 type transport system ATP-binding protein